MKLWRQRVTNLQNRRTLRGIFFDSRSASRKYPAKSSLSAPLIHLFCRLKNNVHYTATQVPFGHIKPEEYHRLFWICVRVRHYAGFSYPRRFRSKSFVLKMFSVQTTTPSRRFQIPPIWRAFTKSSAFVIVSFTAVFWDVTHCSFGEALRDIPKNGCEGDYFRKNLSAPGFKTLLFSACSAQYWKISKPKIRKSEVSQIEKEKLSQDNFVYFCIRFYSYRFQSICMLWVIPRVKCITNNFTKSDYPNS